MLHSLGQREDNWFHCIFKLQRGSYVLSPTLAGGSINRLPNP